MLPGDDFGYETFLAVDAPIQALTAQHANLDFYHVQPAGMLGDVVELQAVQQSPGFGRREGLIKCAGRVGRQIVQHDTDALRFGKVDVHEFLHAGREVNGGAAIGDFDLAPGPMHVEEDEQIGGAIALCGATIKMRTERQSG